MKRACPGLLLLCTLMLAGCGESTPDAGGTNVSNGAAKPPDVEPKFDLTEPPVPADSTTPGTTAGDPAGDPPADAPKSTAENSASAPTE